MTEPASTARLPAALHPAHDHSVTITEDGYVAACGTDVLVDELGYHCEHIAQMVFADVVEMEPANNLPPNGR